MIVLLLLLPRHWFTHYMLGNFIGLDDYIFPPGFRENAPRLSKLLHSSRVNS